MINSWIFIFDILYCYSTVSQLYFIYIIWVLNSDAHAHPTFHRCHLAFKGLNRTPFVANFITFFKYHGIEFSKLYFGVWLIIADSDDTRYLSITLSVAPLEDRWVDFNFFIFVRLSLELVFHFLRWRRLCFGV